MNTCLISNTEVFKDLVNFRPSPITTAGGPFISDASMFVSQCCRTGVEGFEYFPKDFAVNSDFSLARVRAFVDVGPL